MILRRIRRGRNIFRGTHFGDLHECKHRLAGIEEIQRNDNNTDAISVGKASCIASVFLDIRKSTQGKSSFSVKSEGEPLVKAQLFLSTS